MKDFVNVRCPGCGANLDVRVVATAQVMDKRTTYTRKPTIYVVFNPQYIEHECKK